MHSMDGSISTHAVINTSHRPSQDRCESEVLSVNRFLAASQYCGFCRIHQLCTYNHVYVIGILYSLRIHRIHAAHLSYTWYFRKRVYPSVSLRMLFMYFRACTFKPMDREDSRPVATSRKRFTPQLPSRQYWMDVRMHQQSEAVLQCVQ